VRETGFLFKNRIELLFLALASEGGKAEWWRGRRRRRRRRRHWVEWRGEKRRGKRGRKAEVEGWGRWRM